MGRDPHIQLTCMLWPGPDLDVPVRGAPYNNIGDLYTWLESSHNGQIQLAVVGVPCIPALKFSA